MRASLARLDGKHVEKAALLATQHLLSLAEVSSARGVLVCLSFGVEIETRPLIDQLIALGIEIYLPRIESRRRAMTLHRFPCQLERHRFGLEQPHADAPALPAGDIDRRVDVALVLGLAFSLDGFRLGYGGGYFDRFLASHTTLPIGLAFDAQIVADLPRAGHDVPMRRIVTESRVLEIEGCHAEARPSVQG